MDKLETLRNKLDALDHEIWALLDQRFACVDEIGKYKKTINKDIKDTKRETEILNNIKDYQYDAYIKRLYQYLFTLNYQIEDE